MEAETGRLTVREVASRGLRLGLLLFLMTTCLGQIEAHEGWGIVVQPDGTVYFSDIPANTIWRITASGRLEVVARDKHSHALTRARDGNVYGTHEHTPGRPGEVWGIAPDRQVEIIFTAPPDFPMSLHPFAIDDSGAVYSTNRYEGPNGRHQLLRRSSGGEITVIAGAERGFRDGKGTEALFHGIDGLDVTADGSIYLTDGNWLRRVTTEGVVTTLAGPFSAPEFDEDAMGVDASETGEIYVADYSGRRILRVDKDGRFVPFLAAGWPWAPTGVVRHGDAIYVVEHLRMPLVLLGNFKVGPYIRVRRMVIDGPVEVLAVVWGSATWLAAVIGSSVVAGLLVLVRRKRAARRLGTIPPLRKD